MKIIHISDIHGDFETFYKALSFVKNSDAEVLAITGDLSGEVLPKDELEYFRNDYKWFREILSEVYKKTNGEINNLHDIAKSILNGNLKLNDNHSKQTAEEYLKYEKLAFDNMIKNYGIFKEMFNNLEKKVFLVPGNWDGKCINQYLEKENLHLKVKEEFNNITFSGYGSAPSIPSNIPIDLIIPFNESQAYKHLCSEKKAEVVLTHAPLAGFSSNGYGEWSLLAYLNLNEPSLILSGHSHEIVIDRDKNKGTFISNSGNLGRYGKQNFGTFLEWEIDENTFVKPLKFYKIEGDKIKYQDIKIK